jgi:activator of HSP90 ATPase
VQIFFASRVEPPFSGKKASGSVSAHSARSCQLSSSASTPGRTTSERPTARSTSWPQAAGAALAAAALYSFNHDTSAITLRPLSLVTARVSGWSRNCRRLMTTSELHACR